MTRTRIAAIFLVTRVAAVLVSGFSQGIVPKGRWFGPRPFDAYDPRLSFSRWDARWYQSIADNGYSFDPQAESNVVFFPMYPLASRALALLTDDTLLSGLVVSNVCLLLACFVLHALVERETKDRAVADDAVLFLLLSPVGFFFSIFYTEGLFVFLAIGCVECARRGHFGASAVLCAVASATKTLGILLVIPIAMELIEAVRERRTAAVSLVWLAVAPAGLLAYMAYLHHEFGNALVFMDAERAWGRSVTSPLVGLWALRRYSALDRAVAVATIAATVSLIVRLFQRDVWRGYAVYAAAFFLCITSTGVLTALPRHASAIFPLFIALGLVGRERAHARVLILATTTVLFFVSAVAFANGYRIL